ncbi:hypothetical protein V8G54_002650, partial [Vigna mungo]
MARSSHWISMVFPRSPCRRLGGAGQVVCVTGASGYIASWLVKFLLERGYTVKATVRDTNDPEKVDLLLSLDGAKERLHLIKANLLEEGSFDSVVEGCHVVFHAASPFFNDAKDSQHLACHSLYGGDKYYGAKATINVWNPKVQQPNEFSMSQMWILAGSFGKDLNSIEPGWQVLLNFFLYCHLPSANVSRQLYGDNNTRLFTYWTSDAYKAIGCYNLLCSGFIQINSDIALGASISLLSKYSSSQYHISIQVWK